MMFIIDFHRAKFRPSKIGIKMREIFFKKVGEKVYGIRYFIIFVVAKQIYYYTRFTTPHTDFYIKAQSGDLAFTSCISWSVSQQLGWVILFPGNLKMVAI